MNSKHLFFKFFFTNSKLVVLVPYLHIQFHIIRPVLPCFATLLDLAARGAFEWRWIEVVLVRALAHSNGWVRLWALEKAADVPPPLLAKNTEVRSSPPVICS